MEASRPFEDWLVERLKDPAEAAGYLEAVIEQGDQKALMVALRYVAIAQGGVAAIARRAKVTREAAYRMLSKAGNPELRSLNAILGAAGLRLSVRPIVEGRDPSREPPLEVPRMGPPRPVTLGKRPASRVRKRG